MNSTMPSRMRASEMRNWPTSMPKNSDLNQSRMSAPENPHCSIRNGRAAMMSAKVSAISVSRASWLRRGASRPKRASSISPTGKRRCCGSRVTARMAR